MALVVKESTVGWVKPATPITGLDHLGSAAPCIAIYSTLLPGITNVTDRARYYSFYPWPATDSDDTTLSLIASVVRTPEGSGNPMSSVCVFHAMVNSVSTGS